MPVKITTFLIVSLGNIAVGAVLFFFLLLALNGFSGKQAEPGLILFVAWILLSAFAAGILSVFTANRFASKKALNKWLAALVSILVFLVVGAAFDFAGLIAAIILVDALK